MNAVLPPDEGPKAPLPKKIPKFNQEGKIEQENSKVALLKETLARWLSVIISIVQNPLAAQYVDKAERMEILNRMNNEFINLWQTLPVLFNLLGPYTEHFSTPNLEKMFNMIISLKQVLNHNADFMNPLASLVGSLMSIREDVGSKLQLNNVVQGKIQEIKHLLKDEPEATRKQVLEFLYLSVRTVYKEEEIKDLGFF